MASDAVTFIRALGFDEVDLFGFSMGGMIAQVIAQEEPRRDRGRAQSGPDPAAVAGRHQRPRRPTGGPRRSSPPERRGRCGGPISVASLAFQRRYISGQPATCGLQATTS
jgi:pimeloyl-ACP methyl ester carboxylesterase